MNTTATASDLSVANTILAQLGGAGRLQAMTGARQFMGDQTSLTFKLGRGAKRGITCIKVELEPTDTYAVTFYKIGRAPLFDVTEIDSVSLVHVEQLRAVIEAATGFYLSL